MTPRRLDAVRLAVGVVLLAGALGVLGWLLTGLAAPTGAPVAPTTTVCHTGRCS